MNQMNEQDTVYSRLDDMSKATDRALRKARNLSDKGQIEIFSLYSEWIKGLMSAIRSSDIKLK